VVEKLKSNGIANVCDLNPTRLPFPHALYCSRCAEAEMSKRLRPLPGEAARESLPRVRSALRGGIQTRGLLPR